jgi:hypothetical protein
MVEALSREAPRVRRSILAALKHVRPSHLLDPDLTLRPREDL